MLLSVFGFAHVRLHVYLSSICRRSKDLAPSRLPKLVSSKCLREDVNHLNVRVDVLKVDIPNQDTFSDEMVVHLDVLSSSMEDGVSSKVYTAKVSTV